MARFLKSLYKAKGAAPGSFIFIGNKKMDSSKIRLFQYNQKESIEAKYNSIDEAIENIHSKNTNWLNIDGLEKWLLLHLPC